MSPGPEFVLFGPAHLGTLAVVVLACFGLPLAVARLDPAGASLIDLFGPWPWYLLVLEVVAFLSYLVWWSPFALRRALFGAPANVTSSSASGAPPASRRRR